MEHSPGLLERAKRVRVLLMDCDGVLTDGRLLFSEHGEEMKAFNVRDGYGIKAWHAAGFRSGIVSGRNSPIVLRRAAELGIEIVKQGVKDKLLVLADVAASAGVELDEIAFIGDDIPDIDAIRAAGLGAAVGDAESEVKTASDHVCERYGGHGAVRELIDLILGQLNA